MRRSISNSLMIALAILLFSSCSSKKRLQSNSNTAIKADKVHSLADIQNADTDFKTFSSRSKISVSINGKEQEANMSIRIKSDEKIWASITAFAGIEVARVLITPDSIKFINRFQSQYFVKPFSFVQQYAGNDIDFTSLQALLIGNTVPFFIAKGKLTLKEDTLSLSGSTSEVKFESVFNTLKKPQNVELKNEEQRQQLHVSYMDYQSFAGAWLPLNLMFSSQISQQKVLIRINYQQAQFNINQEYPFNIPAKYNPIP